jgi:DivIVA domain-containing protein
VELDRHFIERNDFAAARRGYDPDEVDRHLREIADAVADLKRQQKPSPSSLASAAADQVRGIVEAAETSAAQIQEQAENEASRITSDANNRARETREKADADAVERVQNAEEAAQKIIDRANTVDSEIERLLGELRSATGGVVESLKSGANQLKGELSSIREEYENVREARLEAGVGDGRPSAVDEVELEEEPGPADAEPEVVAEVEDTAPATPEETAVEEEFADVEDRAVEAEEPEPVLEEEPEPEPEPARTGGRSIRGAEGARLIALNMALNGTPREETARYLEDNFDLRNVDAILDEVYARVGG